MALDELLMRAASAIEAGADAAMEDGGHIEEFQGDYDLVQELQAAAVDVAAKDAQIATLRAQLREAEAQREKAERELAQVVGERDRCMADWLIATDELRDEKALTDALVAALPKCTVEGCGVIATKAHARGGPRFCDAHGSGNGWPVVDDYPRAAALRAILASRDK